MRDFFVVLIILTVIIGGNHFIHEYIEESGKVFLENVQSLEKSINSNKEIKHKIVTDLFEKWETNEKIWIMIGYHEEINDIEDLLIECCCYYLQESKNELEISYSKIVRCVEDLKNRERITLTNIL